MVNHKHKYIFIHIPKSGGNSIKAALGIRIFPGNHSKIHQKSAKYMDYFKFAFVRNPWDRLVSGYTYLKAGGISQLNPNKNADNQLCKKINTYFPTIGEFIRHSKWWNWKHFQSQYSYISIDGTPVMDFIGKVENLQQDFNTICDKIGIPQQQLSHTNKSKHKHYTEYYDDETREIVAEKYAKDIEYFGYRFGE
jgi:chondroitin 4-sulfotransferase 11